MNRFKTIVEIESQKEYYQKLTQLSIVHLFALSGMHLTILQKWLMNFLKFFFSKTIPLFQSDDQSENTIFYGDLGTTRGLLFSNNFSLIIRCNR